ncbi:hypothetical protein SISSUDRAFT_1060569 [Sistotremastrum suecicum HHB10207 ss-3]|uniref:F-box domain-containing protein n=1 Tax=Sistotremastrum suecicum HHB10207 ss-3 TaxID=1314776 RepID=A0A166EXI2_9AGAM|nr:hypothetical protein SISSUDRAFT_1060569 [Sistotremastrum suecicum HHB10207 ss-3]
MSFSQTMLSLDNVPGDILEYIAIALCVTDRPLGPPSSLSALLRTCRSVYNVLSFSANKPLYGRIFKMTFDSSVALRRLGLQSLTAAALADELVLRFTVMKRFRSGEGSIEPDRELLDAREVEQITQGLWTAYFMVLENEGKNIEMLRIYARINTWILDYLFDANGASFINDEIRQEIWPEPSVNICLAMSLAWFFLEPSRIGIGGQRTLKMFSLGSHRYSPSSLSWNDFRRDRPPNALESSDVKFYGRDRSFYAPSIVPTAILSFLSLMASTPFMTRPTLTLAFPENVSAKGDTTVLNSSTRWESEWMRTLPAPSDKHGPCWINGCMDGIWEGKFTYMDFSDFAALRHDVPPGFLQASLIAQHDQFWTLREHHLLTTENATTEPLPIGDALSAFLPKGCAMVEDSTGINMQEPGKSQVVRYVRWNKNEFPLVCQSKDIVIVGEGHSNWGRFILKGRVRKSDGFVTLLKEYTDGPRGSWLYRGYVIGHPGGNLVGRWRDTITPSLHAGYEGCFALTPRK